jgi:hypothetical protein
MSQLPIKPITKTRKLESTKKDKGSCLHTNKKIEHCVQWIKGIRSDLEFKFSLSYYVNRDINWAKPGE